MSNPDPLPVARYLQQLFGPPGGEASDAQLLERFVALRDEAAFETLLWRHGPKVLGLCRRVLRHEQDAEDAFQATFLVLARKAASIGRRQALACWLYRVAHRVALRARARRTCPKTLPDVPVDAPASQAEREDVWGVLDEEVNRLPARYRAAFILCYLDGKTNEEAARELGCPRGTVQSRLAWARQRLRARLERRGLTLSVGLAGAVPAGLVQSTVKALAAPTGTAKALTEGVLQAMLWTKVKMAAAGVLILAALGVAGGSWMGGGAAARLGAEPPPKAPAAAEKEKRFAFELRDKPWASVLEWYSDVSGLPYTGKHKPRGKATFMPPKGKRTYTLGEITDILNELLAAQDYILVRRTASFTVLPADEKVDSTMLPEVRLEDLPKRGKTELVTTVLRLRYVRAEDIAPEVNKLLGSFGSVVVMARANQLVLLDTAGNLLRVVKTMREIDVARPPAASVEQRLADVEKRLEMLLEEVKRLRKEVKEKARSR